MQTNGQSRGSAKYSGKQPLPYDLAGRIDFDNVQNIFIKSENLILFETKKNTCKLIHQNPLAR